MSALAPSRLIAFSLLLIAAGLLLTGCGPNMRQQFYYQPLEKSTFFPDERSSRQPVPDTVARSQLRTDELLYTGKVDGEFVDMFPFEITDETMVRGQERFNIYCSPCHSQVGDGNGMIVQRGFPPPPSFHTDRLREAPAGYYFDVITNGFGVMYSYASRVDVEDRWAIVAYIRALQLSQDATVADVPSDEMQQLQGSQ